MDKNLASIFIYIYTYIFDVYSMYAFDIQTDIYIYSIIYYIQIL
jgi:hypothetical protein